MILITLIILQVLRTCYGLGSSGVVLGVSPVQESHYDTSWHATKQRNRWGFRFKKGDVEYIMDCYEYTFVSVEGRPTAVFRGELTSLRDGVVLDNFQVTKKCTNPHSGHDVIKTFTIELNEEVTTSNEYVLRFIDKEGKCHKRIYHVYAGQLSAILERFKMEDIGCEGLELTTGEGIVIGWSWPGIFDVTEFRNFEPQSTPELIKKDKKIICPKSECNIQCRKHLPHNQSPYLVADVYVKSTRIERFKVDSCTTLAVEASFRLESLIENKTLRKEITLKYMGTKGKCREITYTLYYRHKPIEQEGVIEVYKIIKFSHQEQKKCPSSMKFRGNLRKAWTATTGVLSGRGNKSSGEKKNN